MSSTALLLRPDAPEPPASPAVMAARASRPRLGAVIGHLALSLLTASVIPAVLFAVCLATMNVWAAFVAALAWCYGAIGWRLVTRRRMSGLLILTVVGLTAKTAMTFASGDTYLYFIQPAISNVVIASLALLSLATARPFVARLAADFYPMTDDLAMRPGLQRLFWHLTLMWAMVCLAKAVVTVWLYESQSLTTFVMVKSAVFFAMTVVAAAITIVAAVRVARREGLLTHH